MKRNQSSKKKGFVFYQSYFEAIQTLGMKNQLLAYKAIMRYALFQEETENLPPRVLAILKMAMPNIDGNNERYDKKINAGQKNMSGFDKILEEKVSLPSHNPSDDDWCEGEEFLP